MMKIIKDLLIKIINDIDTGNSNLSADECNKVIEYLTEIIDNVINTKPFKVNSGFLGELEIGSGKIKMNLPLVNRALVLSHQDLIELKDMLNQ